MCHKCIWVAMYSTSYSCHIWIKPQFSRQVFEKSSNAKFHENMSSEIRVVPYGRTDGHTVVTKLRVTFRNFANAPENAYLRFASSPMKRGFEGGGGELTQYFASNAHLQATSSWCPNQNPVMEITYHERTDTDFVMKSVKSSHMQWLAVELSWIVRWLVSTRSLVDVNTKGSKLSQLRDGKLMFPLRKSYVAQPWWGLHYRKWTLKPRILLAVFGKWPTYRGKV
jgi:hypothetical protein